MSERIKYLAYQKQSVNSYFWRTYDKQEIDLIEEKDGALMAFECKWNHSKSKLPVAFANAYPDATFGVINQDNYLEWIGG
jgi:uncharacterized protein